MEGDWPCGAGVWKEEVRWRVNAMSLAVGTGRLEMPFVKQQWRRGQVRFEMPEDIRAVQLGSLG